MRDQEGAWRGTIHGPAVHLAARARVRCTPGLKHAQTDNRHVHSHVACENGRLPRLGPTPRLARRDAGSPKPHRAPPLVSLKTRSAEPHVWAGGLG